MLHRIPAWLKQTMIYAGALAIAKAVSFLMVPVFTHYLEPTEFAQLDILQSMADLLSILIGLGLADTLYRFSGSAENEADRKKVAARILGIACLSGILVGIILQLAAPLIQRLLPLQVALLDLRMILISLSFSAIILVPLAWLRMRERATVFFSASAGRAVLQATLAALFLYLGAKVTGVLVAGTIACITLACVALWVQARETGIELNPFKSAHYAGYAGPLILVGLFGFVLGSFDRWVLAGTAGATEVAHYALAAKFGLATAFLVQPFEMWWLPKRFQLLNSEDGRKRCADMAAKGICIALVSAMGVAALGPVAVTLLTPADYHGAAPYIGPLALLAALHMSTTMVNLGLYSKTNALRPMAVEFLAATVALGLYFLLIPGFGAWGAVWATAGALSLRFLVTLYLSQRERPLAYPLAKLSILALITTVTVTACALFSDSSLSVLAGVAGLLVFTFSAQCFGILPSVRGILPSGKAQEAC